MRSKIWISRYISSKSQPRPRTDSHPLQQMEVVALVVEPGDYPLAALHPLICLPALNSQASLVPLVPRPCMQHNSMLLAHHDGPPHIMHYPSPFAIPLLVLSHQLATNHILWSSPKPLVAPPLVSRS